MLYKEHVKCLMFPEIRFPSWQESMQMLYVGAIARNHYVLITTEDGEYRAMCSFAQIEEKLPCRDSLYSANSEDRQFFEEIKSLLAEFSSKQGNAVS